MLKISFKISKQKLYPKPEPMPRAEHRRIYKETGQDADGRSSFSVSKGLFTLTKAKSSFLPPQTKLREGNVFRGVCLSTGVSLPLVPCSFGGGVSLTETPLDRDPPRQRPPWTETPLDRDPPTPVQRAAGQRPPIHHYGRERAVRILLEFILVNTYINFEIA